MSVCLGTTESVCLSSSQSAVQVIPQQIPGPPARSHGPAPAAACWRWRTELRPGRLMRAGLEFCLRLASSPCRSPTRATSCAEPCPDAACFGARPAFTRRTRVCICDHDQARVVVQGLKWTARRASKLSRGTAVLWRSRRSAICTAESNARLLCTAASYACCK